MESSQLLAWNDIDERIHRVFNGTVTSQLTTFTSTHSKDEYTHIASLIKDTLSKDPDYTDKHSRTLAALGFIELEQNNLTAAKAAFHASCANWKASRPNTSGLRCIAGVLDKEGNLVEAEAVLRALIPAVQMSMGHHTSQAVGCMLHLSTVVFKQGRSKEASDILEEAKELLEPLGAEYLKKEVDNADADMQGELLRREMMME